ncbi:MAG: hypothetical protein ACI9QC_000721 [Oceanicoccus sp.]|jgi:hypothetical protein
MPSSQPKTINIVTILMEIDSGKHSVLVEANKLVATDPLTPDDREVIMSAITLLENPTEELMQGNGDQPEIDKALGQLRGWGISLSRVYNDDKFTAVYEEMLSNCQQ